MVSVIGELADGTNALFYIGQGDLKNAEISGAALIPLAGSAATGARVASRAVNAASGVRNIRLFSSKAPGFVSESHEVQQALQTVSQAIAPFKARMAAT